MPTRTNSALPPLEVVLHPLEILEGGYFQVLLAPEDDADRCSQALHERGLVRSRKAFLDGLGNRARENVVAKALRRLRAIQALPGNGPQHLEVRACFLDRLDDRKSGDG